MNFEYLDDAPDGHVMTMLSGKLEVLGVPIFKRRWRTHDGITGHDEYVPEWADRIFVALGTYRGYQMANRVMMTLAKLDAETLNAVLTVFDLGDFDVFTKYALGYETFENM